MLCCCLFLKPQVEVKTILRDSVAPLAPVKEICGAVLLNDCLCTQLAKLLC